MSLGSFEEEVKQLLRNMNDSKQGDDTREYRSEKLLTDDRKSNEMENEERTEQNEQPPSEQPQKQSKGIEQLANSLFLLTAKGAVAFNRFHPRFKDEKFFEDLLNYHIQREEYEVCAKLLKSRNS